METTNPVGQTKSVGFNYGIRKTFDLTVIALWDFIFSPEGIDCWLGKHTGALRSAENFSSDQGRELKVRVWKDYSHVRMDYKEQNWENKGLLQIRVMPGKYEDRSTLSFHLEKLTDAQQREAVKARFTKAMETLTRALEKVAR
ncbi:ATPase [Pedobacter yulinensis]|uniref:ATPase n=1 Tax=Pedobacter yulinensis TaxID=2126353 RepID=A0A2T3HI19_9SPHI|nr:ATPase [Pedobacter yulinensis]PST82088.1 ATPase [Pedobacter yulinensis]